MRKSPVALLLVLAVNLYSQPVISLQEKKFWKDFDSAKPSTLTDYINNGFIAGNYWFVDNPLLIAINNKNYDTADVLINAKIRQKIDINDNNDRDIIYYLIDKNDYEGMLYLLKKRGYIQDSEILYIIQNTKGKEYFRNALTFVKSINSRVLQYRSGGMDDFSSYTFNTLLHESVLKSNMEYINELLNMNADINVIGYYYMNGQLIYASIRPDIYTPLDLAIRKKNKQIIDLLISNGAKKFEDLLAENANIVDSVVSEVSKNIGVKIYANEAIDIKELPREKAFTIGKAKKDAQVVLLKQDEVVTIGDSRSCWYFAKIGSTYGWIKNQYLEQR